MYELSTRIVQKAIYLAIHEESKTLSHRHIDFAVKTLISDEELSRNVENEVLRVHAVFLKEHAKEVAKVKTRPPVRRLMAARRRKTTISTNRICPLGRFRPF